MESVAKYLIAHVDEVLAEWNALRVEEPWTCLPERERIDNLPLLITTLVEAALLRPGEIDSHRALVSAAAEHGRQRRASRLEDDVLFQESYGMRNGIWCVVRRTLAALEAEKVMLRIDSEVTVALQASLLGFHETDLPPDRDWSAQLETLARQSPLLQARRRAG